VQPLDSQYSAYFPQWNVQRSGEVPPRDLTTTTDVHNNIVHTPTRFGICLIVLRS